MVQWSKNVKMTRRARAISIVRDILSPSTSVKPFCRCFMSFWHPAPFCVVMSAGGSSWSLVDTERLKRIIRKAGRATGEELGSLK